MLEDNDNRLENIRNIAPEEVAAGNPETGILSLNELTEQHTNIRERFESGNADIHELFNEGVAFDHDVARLIQHVQNSLHPQIVEPHDPNDAVAGPAGPTPPFTHSPTPNTPGQLEVPQATQAPITPPAEPELPVPEPPVPLPPVPLPPVPEPQVPQAPEPPVSSNNENNEE